MVWWLPPLPSPRTWRFNPHNGWIKQGWMGGKGGKGKRKGQRSNWLNLNMIFCKKKILAIFRPEIKSNIAKVSKLTKNLKDENKIYLFFFAFFANLTSISSLRVMKCSTSPSTHFFLIFSPSSSSSITQIAFSLHIFKFEIGISLGISCKSKSPSTCENWWLNLPLFAPPFQSPPFPALERAKNALP